MSLVLRSPDETITLLDRLTQLGQSARLTRLATGFLNTAALILALGILLLTLDGLFAFSTLGRIAGLTLLVVSVVGFWRARVIAVARRPADAWSVAQELEQRHPRFNDALASAVAFLQDPERSTRLGSARFQQVAVQRATNIAEQTDLDALIPTSALGRAFLLAVMALFVATAAFFLEISRNSTLLLRLVEPYGNYPWPTRTQITIRNPTTNPALHTLGGAFTLDFQLQGIATPQLRWQVESAGTTTDDSLPLDSSGIGQIRLDPARTTRDFRIRLSANDATTDWLEVRVVTPPSLVPWNGAPSPQMTLSYPDYTRLLNRALPPGTGVLEAVSGSQLHMVAATDRPIATAFLRPNFDTTPLQIATLVAALIPAGHPLTPAIAERLASEYAAPQPLHISGANHDHLALNTALIWPGIYTLVLRDTQGIEGEPAPERDTRYLLPTAQLTLETQVTDRLFAIRDVHLEYRYRGATTAQIVPLWHGDSLTLISSTLAGVAGATSATHPTEVDLARKLPVANLRRADGQPPRDGDSMTLTILARDWDDANPLKDVGRSASWELQIVDRLALEAILQKELLALRPPLEELQREQKRTAEALRTGDANALADAERRLREATLQMMEPNNGPPARAARLQETITINELPSSPTVDRTKAVAAELERLIGEELPASEAALAAARATSSANQAGQRAEAERKLATSQATLDGTIRKLEEFLVSVAKSLESFFY